MSVIPSNLAAYVLNSYKYLDIPSSDLSAQSGVPSLTLDNGIHIEELFLHENSVLGLQFESIKKITIISL